MDVTAPRFTNADAAREQLEALHWPSGPICHHCGSDDAKRLTRPDPVRTSNPAVIGPAREDLVVRALNQRIAAASDAHIDQGEPLTELHYTPGQLYRPHHDALPGAANQRRWTMLVYLNQGYGGGQTTFPGPGVDGTRRRWRRAFVRQSGCRWRDRSVGAACRNAGDCRGEMAVHALDSRAAP